VGVGGTRSWGEERGWAATREAGGNSACGMVQTGEGGVAGNGGACGTDAVAFGISFCTGAGEGGAK